MLTPEEIEIRRATLGSSESSAILGVNPYCTAHQVWLSKMGHDTFAGNEATELGNELEPVIAQIYSKRYGRELVKGVYTIHPTERWLSCTPDYHVVGGGLAECKLVGIRTYWQWGPGNTDTTESDAVPHYYLIQAQHQMLVTGEPFNHVAALIGTEFRHYTIRPHPVIQAAILRTCGEWWRTHVETRTPPPVDGSEGATAMLKALFPRHEGERVKADAELEGMVAEMKAARSAADEATTLRNLTEQRIKQRLAEAPGAFGDGWTIRYKTTTRGTRPFVFEDQEAKAAGRAA